MQANFGWKPGQELTYRHWSDGIEVTIPPTQPTLPEIGTLTGYYSAEINNLVRGDVVVVYRGSDVVGFGEYDPEGLHRIISS